MEKYLVVNADDLGLSESVNEGIAQSYREGIVTSASLMPAGEAFDHAVMLAKQNESLDLGVHLSLTHGRPASSPTTVPTLVNGDGHFRQGWLSFAIRYFAGLTSRVEIERECEAQIKKVFAAGLRPSHLDSHQHVHVLPWIREVMNGLARRYGMRFVRRPDETNLSRCASIRHLLKMLLIKAIMCCSWRRKEGDASAVLDHFIGLSWSGAMDKHALERYLRGLRGGVTELMCHPGFDHKPSRYDKWHYRWQQELEALTDPGICALVGLLNVKLVNGGSLNG